MTEDGTILEFHWCFLHGHEACYPLRATVNPVSGLTMQELREKMRLKKDTLRSKGHDVEADEELKAFFEGKSPISPSSLATRSSADGRTPSCSTIKRTTSAMSTLPACTPGYTSTVSFPSAIPPFCTRTTFQTGSRVSSSARFSLPVTSTTRCCQPESMAS